MNDNMIENDPRLSAWLLDEMTASEQQDFEKILDADPSARAAADALRALAADVETALASEPEYRLTDIQREKICNPPALKPITLSQEEEKILPWKRLRYTGDVTEKIRISDRMEERRKSANFPTYWVTGIAAVLLGLAIVGSMIFPRQSEKAVTENTPKTEQEMIVSITSDANPQERPVIVGSDASGYVFRDPSDPAYSTSTFDLHSSKGSYLAISNAIQNGVLPKPASVSIDQMVNYFEYDFPAPKDEESMSVSVEAIPCPWSPESQLVQVGLIGRETAENETGKVEVASGVDVQVQFDPAKVKSYRLLGYENRGTAARAESSDEEKTFAASETTTALYEVVPHEDTKADDSLLTVHLNYNVTDEEEDSSSPRARKMAASLAFTKDRAWSDATADLRFASAVAGFGLFLREDDAVKNALSLSRLKAMASNATDSRDKKRRQLFVALIDKTQKLEI